MSHNVNSVFPFSITKDGFSRHVFIRVAIFVEHNIIHETQVIVLNFIVIIIIMFSSSHNCDI